MKYFLENEELWNEAQKTKDASQFYKLLEKKGLSLIDHVNPDQLFSWIKAALSPELARAAVGEALGEASVSAWETVGLGVFQTDKMTDILDRTIEKLGRWGAFEAYAKDNFGVPLRGHRVFAEAVEFVDRYQALGIPYPDPETMCHGQCEGTGFIPVNFREPGPGDCYHVYSDEKDALYRPLWEAAEAESPSDDGYQFIKCPDCHGSGKIVASKLSVPKGVAKNVRGFDGTLANVKSWQAKIVLGNNLGKDKKKGGWDTVGYVMVNPTTGVVVPVACGDEHQTGTELLYHYQDLGYLNANGFVPMTTGFNYFDMSDPTFLKVIKFWLDNGGPDGHVHDSRTREAGLMSEWLAGAGKRIVEPGKLAAGGQAWIEALEDFSKAWAKLPADREPDEGLVKNLFDAAYAVRQIAYDWHFMWGSPGDVIDRLFTAQDYKGLGDVVLGMSGTKNKVHGKLKELIADPNDYETQDFKNFFGDLGVAKAELDRLGGIKAASANIKFWIDPSRNFHGFGGAAHYLDNVAHIDWLKQNNIEYTETDDSAFGELPAKGWVRGYVQDGSLSLTIDPGVVKVENVLEDVPQEYRFVDDIFVEGVLNADGFAENLGQAIVLDGEDALDAWKHRNDVRHRVEAVKAVDPVTETPEFKAWFAGSQVVDKTGAPQLVNHGTDVVGIEKFHGDTGDVVPGLMYFSDKIGVARSYGSVLYQCYLKMTSPLVEDLGGASYGEVLPSAYAVQARDNGYDGVILTNIKDDVGSMKNGTNYMVWNPDQIWKVSEKQRGSSQSLRPAMTLKERQKLVKDKLDADELAQETSMREHDAWVNSPAADQWKKDRAKVAKANKAKKAVTASIVAHVRKRGSKWVVTNKAGTKTLGTHDSKESADKQLAAIEIAKHAHGSLRAENKFDRLYREAVDVSQNDAKYSGALENPSLAQEMGQFQQAVKDSRSEEELQQAWSRFQPSVTWEALTALAGHESQEPTTV
jgi:hypothetical protein